MSGVFRKGNAPKSHGPIFRPGVRIDHELGFAREGGLAIENALVLEAVVLPKIIPTATFEWRADLLVVPELGEAFLDRLTVWEFL